MRFPLPLVVILLVKLLHFTVLHLVKEHGYHLLEVLRFQLHELLIIIIKQLGIINKKRKSGRSGFDLTDEPDIELHIIMLGQIMQLFELPQPIIHHP